MSLKRHPLIFFILTAKAYGDILIYGTVYRSKWNTSRRCLSAIIISLKHVA